MDIRQMSNEKIILDLCGGTGAWSQPYREAGYDVRNITLPEFDVRLFKKPKEKIYGILAAPPCTHLSLSGARYWKTKGKNALLEALSVVDACLRIVMVTKPRFWALENPVGRLKDYLGKPKMYFQPYEFGDPYSKKTCLWGDFNPPRKIFIKPPKVRKTGNHSMDVFHKITNHKNRSAIRSITPKGFARAFFEANR